MPERAVPTVAVVIPVFREPDIGRQLDAVSALSPDELLVVEAGDAPTRAAIDAFLHGRSPNLRVLCAERGRAAQMNAGAGATHADILLFLHADTILPPDALVRVRDAVARGAIWGRFDVRLSGRRPGFRVIERLMNLRSALTGIATGDQAMFVRRDAFTLLGGFAAIELMEDIELSARLKWIARPVCIRAPVVTSSRRWENGGLLRTLVRMWVLRAAYALGVSPRRLAQWYK